MTESISTAPSVESNRQSMRFGAMNLAYSDAPGQLRYRGVSPRWYWLTPLIAIVLFIVMMGAIMWWLNVQETTFKREALQSDIESAQQTLRIKLLSNQDALAAIARGIGARELDEIGFHVQARELINAHPELVAVTFVNIDRIAAWSAVEQRLAGFRFRPEGEPVSEAESQRAFDLARDDRRLIYTRPFTNTNGNTLFEVQIPVFQGARFFGAVIGVYAIEEMLPAMLPAELRAKYSLSIADQNGAPLLPAHARAAQADTVSYQLVIDPPGHSLFLRAYAPAARPQFAESLLFWLVFGLSALIVWSLGVVWRHMRQRIFAEQAVAQETNFRRAMENSISTGMRAISRDGHITYVNAAFCKMTGFDESVLIGAVPPFPYWPSDRLEENVHNIRELLAGRTPPEGLEVQVQRKDGSRFYARMYVSRLIDEHGNHTGWMTSITDITEPKRVRESLAAAQDRFTTVLESLEATVTVVAHSEAFPDGELLFANRYYRQLFGNHAQGHLELTGTPGHDFLVKPDDSLAHEVYSQITQKWFEVRSRHIEWVDGRAVRMQIATDITKRREAEELSRQQQEKVALTSRLITMGEMASSLAHELNQPLTAIANYSMGTLARLKSSAESTNTTANQADLIQAMEKTSQQAERAGAIIRRIREFVKRSEPNRRMVDIRSVIDDAKGLVEIDAAKRQIRIQTYIESNLPMIPIDPIMIEQVLINLMKNGIEAMSDARARVLTVSVSRTPHHRPVYLAIDVIDRGTGIADDALPNLFEPFYTTKAEGMGMGLNICRSIVEFHKGRLWAENNMPSPGSVFHLLLPISRNMPRGVMGESVDMARKLEDESDGG